MHQQAAQSYFEHISKGQQQRSVKIRCYGRLNERIGDYAPVNVERVRLIKGKHKLEARESEKRGLRHCSDGHKHFVAKTEDSVRNYFLDLVEVQRINHGFTPRP